MADLRPIAEIKSNGGLTHEERRTLRELVSHQRKANMPGPRDSRGRLIVAKRYNGFNVGPKQGEMTKEWWGPRVSSEELKRIFKDGWNS